MKSETVRAILTKTQYKYWVEYYYNDMNIEEIARKYNVHFTTVSRVLINARRRFMKYEKGA